MKEMRDFAARRGQAMREQAMAMAKKRKEEFIGARVPKELRDKVIKQADEEGVSVSIWVRRILEQAFSETPSLSTTMDTQERDNKANEKVLLKQKFANVLGWESIVLNTAVSCAHCDVSLKEGESVAVGLVMTGGRPVVLCNDCKEAF